MKTSLKFLHALCAGLLLNAGIFNQAMANNDNDAPEKIYLVQIMNQLDAIQPLIIAAEKAAPKNRREQFHYTKFVDAKGVEHNGLLEDIQAIKKGIAEQLNQPQIEPRSEAPIAGDYAK